MISIQAEQFVIRIYFLGQNCGTIRAKKCGVVFGLFGALEVYATTCIPNRSNMSA